MRGVLGGIERVRDGATGEREWCERGIGRSLMYNGAGTEGLARGGSSIRRRGEANSRRGFGLGWVSCGVYLKDGDRRGGEASSVPFFLGGGE